VEARVRAAHAVGITVTSGTRAGRIGLVMAGSTVLNIILGGTTMFGYPRERGMPPRHTPLSLMTAITEGFCVVAFAAIGFLALCVETVSVLVVQIVDIAGQVIASVTLQARDLFSVALFTPGPIDSGLVTMLMSPVSGMNVNQRNLFTVTQRATFIGFTAIMTIQTDAHCGHICRGECPRLGDSRMTMLTLEFLSNMLLMVEFNLPFGVGNGLWFFQIMVTHTAFLIIVDGIVALPTGFHGRHHAIP